MTQTYSLPAAAATDLPTWSILIDGSELAPEIHVMSLTVTESVNHISRARIELRDGSPAEEDFPLSNLDTLVPGKEVVINAGYHGEESQIFCGQIVRQTVKTRAERGSRLILDCRHQAVKLTVRRFCTCYYEVTDSDLIEELFSKHGVSADVESTNTLHQVLRQYNCSDWELLLRRAQAAGLLVTCSGDAVRVKKLDSQREPQVSVIYGGTLLEAEVEMDARTQASGVNASAWEQSSQSTVSVDAQFESLPSLGNVDADTLAGTVSEEPIRLVHGGNRSREELQNWADAQLLRSRLSRIRGRVRFRGLSNLASGDFIEVSGLGQRFSGTAFVSGLRHELGRGIWTTDAQLGLPDDVDLSDASYTQPDTPGLLASLTTLQVGTVMQLEGDPDSEERILVQMPLLGESDEGVWARLATLDAGQERGTVFRPEIDDEVVVGFVHGDPRDAIVLGMLHSSAKPAPLAASDDNHEKGLVTRCGSQIVFNDEQATITVSTPNGNGILLSDEGGALSLTDENDNTVVLDSNGITLESPGAITLTAQGDVTLEGVNININASGELKASAGGSGEVSSTGSMAVKGSVVQIN